MNLEKHSQNDSMKLEKVLIVGNGGRENALAWAGIEGMDLSFLGSGS